MELLYLDTLNKISKSLITGKPLKEVLESILILLSGKLGMQRGLISIFHKNIGELHANIWYGLDTKNDKQVKYKLGEGISGKVAKYGVPMAFSKLDDVPFFLDRTGARKNLDLSQLAFICVPIKYCAEVIGTLSVDQTNVKKDVSELYMESELKLLNITASLIASYLEQLRIERENKLLKDVLLGDDSAKKIIGNSSKLKKVMHLVAQVSQSTITTLIIGETGTGKELVANAIHGLSPRKNKPYVRINCGAIPETLIESELFGYEKGSFTGAVERKIGKLESAHAGTLFLDEIGELPLLSQVKLLRVLQEKEIERIGSSSPVKIDVRIIAATNRSLEEEVKKGNFRSDLYYRLNVFPIHVPPLRERGADITLLADYFIEKYSKKTGKNITRISTAAIDALIAYHWPGNIRELENCVERAVIIANDHVIQYQDLPPTLQMKDYSAADKGNVDLFNTRVRAFEKELIIDALKQTRGNQAKAAKYLQTTSRVIQYKIKNLNIDLKKFKGK